MAVILACFMALARQRNSRPGDFSSLAYSGGKCGGTLTRNLVTDEEISRGQEITNCVDTAGPEISIKYIDIHQMGTPDKLYAVANRDDRSGALWSTPCPRGKSSY